MMTFENEDIRMQFHELPTETQRKVLEFEDAMSFDRKCVHIVAVDMAASDVIIRISGEPHFSFASRD